MTLASIRASRAARRRPPRQAIARSGSAEANLGGQKLRRRIGRGRFQVHVRARQFGMLLVDDARKTCDRRVADRAARDQPQPRRLAGANERLRNVQRRHGHAERRVRHRPIRRFVERPEVQRARAAGLAHHPFEIVAAVDTRLEARCTRPGERLARVHDCDMVAARGQRAGNPLADPRGIRQQEPSLGPPGDGRRQRTFFPPLGQQIGSPPAGRHSPESESLDLNADRSRLVEELDVGLEALVARAAAQVCVCASRR